MIGIDFPIRPEWIHSVHQLWQPELPISDLIDQCLTNTMGELGGEKTRRNTLSIILRIFVKTKNGGTGRITDHSDPWPAYSKHFSINDMLPAYLTQLICESEVARESTDYINRRFTPGDTIQSKMLREFLIGKYGQRKVVLNAGSAFLKTLQHFGVFQAGSKMGEYIFKQKLQPGIEVYPMIFWALWQTKPTPQVDYGDFFNQPGCAFLEITDHERFWKAYQPALWILSERFGANFVTLKSPDENDFQEQLISILGTNS